MPATGTEIVTLSQLKMLGDILTSGGGSQAQRRFISMAMVIASATHTLMKATSL